MDKIQIIILSIIILSFVIAFCGSVLLVFYSKKNSITPTQKKFKPVAKYIRKPIKNKTLNVEAIPVKSLESKIIPQRKNFSVIKHLEIPSVIEHLEIQNNENKYLFEIDRSIFTVDSSWLESISMEI